MRRTTVLRTGGPADVESGQESYTRRDLLETLGELRRERRRARARAEAERLAVPPAPRGWKGRAGQLHEPPHRRSAPDQTIPEPPRGWSGRASR